MEKTIKFLDTSLNSTAKVWRYMDFTKFLSILEKDSLYFTRADKFEDKFEGSYPKSNVQTRSKRLGGKLPDEAIKDFSIISEKVRRFMLVNCWHINENESEAMWELYSQSKDAIAIQSNVNRLVESFYETEEEITMGLINYIDYEKDTIPETDIFDPFIYKRLSFKHENEFRIFVNKSPGNGNDICTAPDICEVGMDIHVIVDKLIENIYISPLAPNWFYELVKQIIKNRYGLNKEVIYSELNNKPVF